MFSQPSPAALTLALAIFLASPAPAQTILPDPPGFRPRPPGLHALTGARFIPQPGVVWTNATLVISNGLIQAILQDAPPPPAARVWDLHGSTIYAGFIEPHLSVDSTPPIANNDVQDITAQGAAATSTSTSDATQGSRFYGVAGQETDPGPGGPGSASPQVTPERRVATFFSTPPKTAENLRQLGFTVAHAVPARGIVRGQSAVLTLGNASPNASLIQADTAQCLAFDAGSFGWPPPPNRDAFPGSLMGVLALIRQTFLDTAHYQADHQHYQHHPDSRPRPAFNTALAALQPVLHGQKILIEPGSVLMALRAASLAREFAWNHPLLLASGQEWRRPDLLAAQSHLGGWIVPLTFPALPKFPDDSGWEGVSLDQLRAWDWAPENPALLRRLGQSIALTTHGLDDRKEFRANLRAAIDRGLSEDDALAALTTVPARLLGLDHQLGTIAPGRPAHLTVVDGPYFNPKSRVQAVWIDGLPYELPPPTPAPSLAKPVPPPPPEPAPDPTRDLRKERVAREPGSEHARPLLSPFRPPAVLVLNATIWTAGPQGTLTNAMLIARDGRIVDIRPTNLEIPADAAVIDGTGLHVTPGLIDAHSHSMILGMVNEGTLPSTAMVRIADVIHSESPNIHLQLAGGLTVANLLHGSANPIGGQNAVIKLRLGAGPDDLLFKEAPAGIKFALGENVKQSNWGDRHTTRFPQSRMGVPTFFANRFTAARAYADAHRRFAATQLGPPPRRDLELEALAEIIEGSRLIHCHSYRQDEIVAFLRTMESFDVRVATLQHILEGYKVADEIARHGAGASAFSDWWAFKFEVIDAIPYAGSLMHARGVNVSFNSDSSDHARRLHLEAAKAVKYGNTPPEDALRFVTLNPARQLRIDHRVGSLEPGKDADFVLWSGHPLDSRSACLETWIEGARYFVRDAEPARVRALSEEREALLAKARNLAKPKGDATSPTPSDAARQRFFLRALETARHLGVADCQDCELSTLD